MSDKIPADGSITKELRELAASAGTCGVLVNAGRILSIANRIDVEHERALSRQSRESYNDGFFAGERITLFKMSSDELLEHGLVRLPVGADGKTLRIGDEVTLLKADRTDGSTGRVTSIVYREDHVALSIAPWGCGHLPDEVRHHKPTPAERIRAWVASAKDDRADLKNLLEIADELEGGCNES